MGSDRHNPEKIRRGASGEKLSFTRRWQGYKSHHRTSFRQSLNRMAREPLQTTMTVAVIAIALALPAALYLVTDNLQKLAGHFEASEQMTVFVKRAAKPEALTSLKIKLEALSGVASVDYISARQALLEFKAQSGFGSALHHLEENPLPPVFLVQPLSLQQADLAHIKQLSEKISHFPAVDDVLVDMVWLQRLYSLTEMAHKIVVALWATLGLGVLLVVANTIRLAIQNRRDEIIIVKLVGGTSAYVRRPFLYTGVLLGLFGAVTAMVMLSFAMQWLNTTTESLAGLYNSPFRLTGLGISGVLSLMGLGGLLGLLGAWVAVSRHLREIRPQ